MKGRSRFVVVSLALLASAGCSSAVRSRAVTLADGGAAAARAAASSIAGTGAGLDAYVEAQLLLGPLTGRPEPDEGTLASLEQVRTALGARAEVMRSLESAYAAFSAYASHDAAGQVEQGVNALTGAVNAYGEALKQPPVSPKTAWTLAKAGGAFAGAKQAKGLKAASAGIRTSVERCVELLRREKEALASVRRVLVEGQGATARAFVALGLGRPGALLAPHVSGFGLAWDEKQLDPALALLRKEPSITKEAGRTREDDLRRGLERVLDHRVRRRADLEAAMGDEVIGGLEALAAAHGRFEASEEVDLAALTEHVATLRATLDEYRAISAN